MSSPSFAIYARKSTESEERQIQSIDDQVRLARAALGDEPIVVITEAMSAKEPDRRPEFRRLLALVERGRVDTIVAWHPDRLSRNEMDAARICYLVRTGKLNLRFVNYFFDNSPEGMMMLQMALSQSQYYSSKLSKDVRRGLDSRIAKGWWPGKAPEGYLNDLEAHTVVADPARLPLLRRAFLLLLDGTHTVNQVLTLLNEEWGYRTRRRKNTGGGELSRSAAYRLFSDPFYAGWMEVKGELHRGAHPAILTLEEFNRVQDMIKIRKGFTRHDEFTYQGLIRCARCGRAATCEVQKGRHKRGNWVYYRCGNPGCPGPKLSLREDQIDRELERRLLALTWPPEFKEVVLAEFEAWMLSEYGDLDQIMQQRAAARDAIDRKRSALLEMRLAAEIDAESFAQKDAELREELNRLKLQTDDAAATATQARESIRRVAEFTTLAYESFRIGTRDHRREIAGALAARYELRDGRLVIEYNPLLPAFQRNIEPLEIGFEKQKGTRFEKRVPHGWESGNLREPFLAALNGACLPDFRYVS